MIVRGPFTLVWGEIEIEDVLEVELIHDKKADQYEANNGRVYDVDKTESARVILKLLSSDTDILAALLPQALVTPGDTMSTGEVADPPGGALEFAPDTCATEMVYNNLDIISCGIVKDVIRIVNARTKLGEIEIDGKVRKVSIEFVGEPPKGQAVLQMFKLSSFDTFLLDDNDDFILDSGDLLIL